MTPKSDVQAKIYSGPGTHRLRSIDNQRLQIVDPKTLLGRDAPSRARRRIRTGDILFSTVRPYLKNIAIVPSNLDGHFTSTGICVLRPAADIESGLIFKHVISKDFIDAMTQASDGTMYPAIADKDVFEGKISLPPAAEQRRVVAKLDALTARIARARAELDRVKVLAARERRVLLDATFHATGLIDDLQEQALDAQHSEIDGRTGTRHALPDGWQWISLGEICDVSGGLTKSSKRDSLPLTRTYLRVANVYADELRLDDVAEIGCTESEFARTRLQKGDLLIVEGNGSLDQVGRVALWGGQIAECSHQNHLIRVRPRPAATARFLLYWLLSPAGRIHLERLASSSSGLHTLSISKVAGMPCPLPPVDQQIAIVERLDAAFARTDRLEAEAARSRKLLDRLESAILAKAFRGELVPQDPNDEPASVLLERIRTQRAAAPKPARGRRRGS